MGLQCGRAGGVSEGGEGMGRVWNQICRGRWLSVDREQGTKGRDTGLGLAWKQDASRKIGGVAGTWKPLAGPRSTALPCG